ncbi:MAG: NAD kinase [Bacteroidales bacterium]|nr:NAD kinase [Bacteroidales bacterium]
MRIAIFGKEFNDNQLDYVRILIEALEIKGCKLLIWKPFHDFIKDRISFRQGITLFYEHTDLKGQADLLFSVGGDGTMLHSVRLVRDSGIPISGINLGRMGFLSSIPPAEIFDAVEDIMENRYRIVKRTLISLISPHTLFSDFNYAFNELSINKKENSSLVVVHVWVNDQLLHSYWADGLIIATPTGSTAYSLSCGGPILTPDSNNFVITPIAPHNLSVRPVVIPDSSLIRIKVDSRDEQALVGLDSQSAIITPDNELVVGKADFEINLVQRLNENFFSTIRAKLNWGSDIRN